MEETIKIKIENSRYIEVAYYFDFTSRMTHLVATLENNRYST